MNCKHQFFEIHKVCEYENGSPIYRPKREGTRVGCALCGEVREVWSDGEVKIIVKGQYHDDPANSDKPKDTATQPE